MKLTHGGARFGAGRKKKPLAEKLVVISGKVLQVTKSRIKTLCVEKKISVGKLIDEAFKEGNENEKN